MARERSRSRKVALARRSPRGCPAGCARAASAGRPRRSAGSRGSRPCRCCDGLSVPWIATRSPPVQPCGMFFWRAVSAIAQQPYGPPPVSRSVSVTPKRPVGVGEPGPPTPTAEPPDDLALVADGARAAPTGRSSATTARGAARRRRPGSRRPCPCCCSVSTPSQPVRCSTTASTRGGAPAGLRAASVATIFPPGSSRRPTLRSSFAPSGPCCSAPGSAAGVVVVVSAVVVGVVATAGGVTSAPCSESAAAVAAAPGQERRGQQRGEHREPARRSRPAEAVEQLVGERHVVRAEIGPVVEDRHGALGGLRIGDRLRGSSWRTACRRSAPSARPGPRASAPCACRRCEHDAEPGRGPGSAIRARAR